MNGAAAAIYFGAISLANIKVQGMVDASLTTIKERIRRWTHAPSSACAGRVVAIGMSHLLPAEGNVLPPISPKAR
jgi:hypothetical protein